MIECFEVLHLDCDCADVSHTLRFIHEKDDVVCPIYTEVPLNIRKPFWKRLWIGLKYIFGRQSQFGHFDCFLLNRNNAILLKKYIEQVYETSRP